MKTTTEKQKDAFKVTCAEFNADTFRWNYSQYITREETDAFGNIVFSMRAPHHVKEEVETLTEECIFVGH